MNYENMSVEELKQLTKKGDVDAIYNYGLRLFKIGTSKNRKKAAKYLKMAADKGNAMAMNTYGDMLQLGVEIPVNKEEAAKYLKMAADNKNTDGMFNYGYFCLLKGEGVPVNKEEAAKYLKMAADRGNKDAKIVYAIMLEIGFGIEKNPSEARKYYKGFEYDFLYKHYQQELSSIITENNLNTNGEENINNIQNTIEEITNRTQEQIQNNLNTNREETQDINEEETANEFEEPTVKYFPPM